MPLFLRLKFSCVVISECSHTSFSNFLVLFPYSCVPLWKRCNNIQRGTGYKHYQLRLSKSVPLTLYEMGNAQVRLYYFPLVIIWVLLSALPEGGIIRRILENPMCGSLLERFETPHSWYYDPEFTILVYLKAILPLEWFLEQEQTQYGDRGLWPKPVGVQEEVPSY